jgi:hypothetical protein
MLGSALAEPDTIPPILENVDASFVYWATVVPNPTDKLFIWRAFTACLPLKAAPNEVLRLNMWRLIQIQRKRLQLFQLHNLKGALMRGT